MESFHQRERRRIQISGKSSFVVALPKKWVSGMDLQHGDEVTITRPSTNSLLITFDIRPLRKLNDQYDRAVVEYQDNEDSQDTILRKIEACYVSGYTIIEVICTSSTSHRLDNLKEKARRNLIGTEIVGYSSSGFTIQVLLGSPELRLNDDLKRVYSVCASMFKEAIRSVKRQDKNAANLTISQSSDVYSLNLYVMRKLNMFIKGGISGDPHHEQWDLLSFIVVIKALQNLSNESIRIARTVLGLQTPFGADFIMGLSMLSDLASRLIDESFVAVLKIDHSGAAEIAKEVATFNEKEEEFQSLIWKDKEVLAESRRAAVSLIDSLRAATRYALDICSVVLDFNIEKFSMQARSVETRGNNMLPNSSTF